MQNKAAQETAQNGKHRRTGRRLLRALACVVVFCTVYALILPALTLERSPECGMEEHRHTEECYTQVNTVSRKVPVCTRESLGVHTHTESCPVENGQYACGLNDYVIHTHDENCYNEDGTLWCTLPEMGEHMHTDACYAEAQDAAAHVHTDACYSTVRGELICSVPTEAHTHTEACYAERETIICTLAESEGHQHGEGCFDENGVLTCGLEESESHTHGADCYGVIRELVCTQSEQAHEHTDACYTAERVLSCELPTEAGESGTRRLICGLQQGTAHQHGTACFQSVAEPADTEKLTCTKAESDGHKHGKQCYGTWTLSCEKEEHSHNESCYQSGDPGADLESEAVWEKSVAGAERNGDWRHDVIAVAETQIGYTESSRNYIKDETGTRKGYTRYGAWYGDAYGDWCAMFVSFCMHYAEIPTESFPAESSCQRWIEVLKSEEYGLYREAGSYTPRTGDVIFFDWDGDGIANHVGLVTELVHDEQGTATEIKTIEGNNGTQVAQFSYAADDARILGYGEMPQKPSAPKRQMSKANAVSNGPKQELEVTDISADGTSYDPENDVYIILLTIDFKIETAGVTADTEFVYNYPKEVIIPPGLLDIDKPVYDKGGIKVGKRRFTDNGDGTYSVHVKIDEEYLDSAGKEIIGDLGFGGTLDASPEADGGIVVDAGGKDLQIVIPADKITYPADETNKYNIDVIKSGSFNPNGNKLNYTVYIRSTKGTPDPIQFNDVINADGLALGTPTVKVEKGEFENKGQWDRPDKQGSFTEVQNPSYTWDSANNKLSMSLDGLAPGADDKTGTCYKITYTYDLPKTGVTQAAPNNKVTAEAEDKTTGQTVKDENNITVHIDKKHRMSKVGWYDNYNKRIRWTITVNSDYKNIVGALFSDGMLKDSYDLKFEPNEGYELQEDGAGKITGIKFTEINGTGINTQKYEIVYFTKPETGWNDQEIINEAEFDPTPGDKNNGDEIPKEAKVTVNGDGWVTKNCEGMAPSTDGRTGEISWKVTMRVPEGGLPKKITIADKFTTSNGTGHWMSSAQIQSWSPILSWENGGTVVPAPENISFSTADGTKYSYTDIMAGKVESADELRFTGFEIAFPDGVKAKDGLEQNLYLSCKTTADLENAPTGETKFINRVDVGDKNATAEYKQFKGGVIKTDGSDKTGTSHTSSEGALAWKVKVMSEKECGKLTVTDTLPEGVILDGVSLSGATNMALTIDEYGFITGENDTYRIEGRYLDSEVTLTMTGKNGKTLPKETQYVFTFDCHADETALEDYGPGKSYTFTNSVTAKADETEIGSSEQTQDWTNSTPVVVTKIIDKAGSWDNDNRRLNYAIEINPNGEDLVKGTDDLTLIDTMYYSNVIHHPYNAKIKVTLIPESVKLYKATRGEDGNLVEGEEITDWSWVRGRKDNGENTEITITAKGIPDKTPLIFLYSYSVESTIKKGTEAVLGIRNTARLEGTSESDSDDAGGVKWMDQTSFGSVTTGKTYTFFKTEENNFGKRLENAEFTVYRYDPAIKGKGAYVLSYLTDRNGKFQIEWDDKNNTYEYGTVYMVTETKAPEGYILPDTPQVFYFYFSDPTGATPLPADIPAGAVDLTENSETVYVENEKNAVDITVNKRWFNKDGSSTMHTSGTVALELYRRESDRPDAGGDTKVVGEIQCGNSGSISFDECYPEGTILTFSIEQYNFSENNVPTLSFNGLAPILEDVSTYTTNVNNWMRPDRRYTYSIELRGGENTLNGSANHYDSKFSGFTPTYPEDTGTPQAPFDKATISYDGGWQYTFADLPKLEDKDGKKTYYYYYVKEVSVPNYTTSYENNGGIAGGTITVKNTLNKELNYELPQTGGGGTQSLYAAGALLTLGAGGLLLRGRRKRKREEAGAS